MKLTPEGKKKMEGSLQEMRDSLQKLREEQATAYTLSGDTWHDNPYFNKLVQDERTLTAKIQEAEKILETAEIVDSNSRSMESVKIGSIVKCRCTYPQFENIGIYEIAGHGETDLQKGKLDYESPVAQNLMGHHVGDVISFQTPAGVAKYTILKFFANWDDAKKDSNT